MLVEELRELLADLPGGLEVAIHIPENVAIRAIKKQENLFCAYGFGKSEWASGCYTLIPQENTDLS